MLKIKDFVLEDNAKLHRAKYGTMGRGGKTEGGVGENASEEEILVAYDKLGGLITKDGNKVKTGCFYDFEKKCPRMVEKKDKEGKVTKTYDFKVVYEYRDGDGKLFEMEEGQEEPLEVKVVKKKAKKVK